MSNLQTTINEFYVTVVPEMKTIPSITESPIKCILVLLLQGKTLILQDIVNNVVVKMIDTLLLDIKKYNILKSGYIQTILSERFNIDSPTQILSNLENSIKKSDYSFLNEKDNYYGYNIMHWCAILGYGYMNIFEYLRKRPGCTLLCSDVDKEGFTPLHMSNLMRPRLQVLSYPKLKEVKVNIYSNTMFSVHELSLLMINSSIKTDAIELKQIMLFLGKHIQTSLPGFGSLLHLAILLERPDMFEIIVSHPEYYAKQTFKNMLIMEDYMHRTPLMLATQKPIIGSMKIPFLIKTMQSDALDYDIKRAFNYAMIKLCVHCIKIFIKELSPDMTDNVYADAIATLKSLEKDTTNSEQASKASFILKLLFD